MYTVSLTISRSLTLVIVTASLALGESFVSLQPRASLYSEDYGLSNYLRAREATPFEDARINSWDYDHNLLRRYADPQPQLNTDTDFDIVRVYRRAPAKSSNRNKGNQGSNRKPPRGPLQGDSSSISATTKTAVKDSHMKDSLPKPQPAPLVNQNYNWPPPSYNHMSTAERRAAAVKARQNPRKTETTTKSPVGGSSVRDMVKKYETLDSEKSTSSTATTNKMLADQYAEKAGTDKSLSKPDEAMPPPVSNFGHPPGSSASSWASISRASSAGVSDMSRQNSIQSTLSGVHVDRHAGIGDGWTVL